MADETVTQAVDNVAEVAAVEVKNETDEVKTEAETSLQRVEREIETWFTDLRQNLSALDTETHNKLYAAKEALKELLTAIL